MRVITLTEASIILDIAKTESNNCFNSGASAREARQRSTMGKKNWSPIKSRKFGYDVSVRTSVQTRGEGEGRLKDYQTKIWRGSSRKSRSRIERRRDSTTDQCSL